MSLTQEQREARRTRVGASEVAALLTPSQHPFTTPAAIYDRIVNGTETEANEAMRDGQLMEPYVLDAAREKYRLHARAATRAYTHPTLPVTASPDALLLDGEGLVEVKCTRARWLTQPPPSVLAQVQCQLWLTHRTYAQVVVCDPRLSIYMVERDQRVIDAIEEAVASFWGRHLRPHIPPPPPIDTDPLIEWSTK